MFESNDYIYVDDEFLNEVFDNDHNDQAVFNRIPRSSIKYCENDENIDKNQAQSNLHKPTNEGCGDILTNQRKCGFSDGVLPRQISTTPLGSINITFSSASSEPSSNKENKRNTPGPSPGPSRSKRERKFPGPAGLLPDRKSSQGTPLKFGSFLEADMSPPNATTDDLCSQGRCSGSVTEDEPWRSLLEDLGEEKSILDRVNVASVKRKATAKCFVGKKVPFLAAVLHHMDMTSPDPGIILRDCTGEIHGTLHREVWEQFASDLAVGSVLVVRNMGLLSTRLSSWKPFLNITADNLVAIYSKTTPGKQGRKRQLQPFSKPDINLIIDNWKTLVSSIPNSPARMGARNLFDSSFSSPVNSGLMQSTMHSNTCENYPKRTERYQNPSKVVNNERQNSGKTSFSMPKVLSGVVKNMPPSIRPSQQQSSINNIGKAFSCAPVGSRLLNSNGPANSVMNKSVGCSSMNSNFSNRPMRISSGAGQTKCINNNRGSFHFNPVTEKQITISSSFSPSSCNAFPNQVNESNCGLSTVMANNGSRIILSQNTELSAEDTLAVESVFDGIDVDSLFDDDF